MEKKIRASAVPGIMKCNASKYPPKIPIRTDGEPAHIGSAVHAPLASLVDGSYAWDIARACDEYEVDEKEVSYLYHVGKSMWDKLKDSIEVLEVETEHTREIGDTGWINTGHMDVAGWYKPVPGTLVVIDWKTGRVDSDYTDQTIDYAWLIHPKYPEATAFKVVTAWLRDNRTVVKDVTLEGLQDFERRLISAVTHDDYHPGSVCEYCSNRLECNAQKSISRASVETMLAIGSDGMQEVTPALLSSLYVRSRLVKKAIDDYESALRVSIANNGPMQIEDGRVLKFVDEPRDKIHLDLETLKAYLPIEKIQELTTISKTALNEAIGDVAPARQKGALRKAVVEQLRECGAIETSTIRKLVAKKEN
jgi:hypothetical protein